MTSKPKPRFDLSNRYYRAGFPKTISKDEISDIFGTENTIENLEQFIESLADRMARHLIKSEALNNKNIPTPAEYRATFQDLIENITNIESKLSALNSFPFDHMIDGYILTEAPEHLPCDFIDETIHNLVLIKDASTNALNNIEVTAGRRKNIYTHISMFVGIAEIFEEYTGSPPTSTCSLEYERYGEYANLVRLCCEKVCIPITSDFCNQIGDAIKEYKNSGKSTHK